MTIREKVTEAMQNQSVSRYRLAKLSGVSESHINRYLNGESDLTGDKLDKVFKVLGLVIKKAPNRN